MNLQLLIGKFTTGIEDFCILPTEQPKIWNQLLK